MTNFGLVKEMNSAFGNAEGNPLSIDVARVRNQCKNILDEFCELIVALGADSSRIAYAKANFLSQLVFTKGTLDVDATRDALCDIHVFAYGAHHMIGYDADRDMNTVVGAVLTRFVKDQADLLATITKHAAAGITETYTEGEFPKMILKSAKDQPDAPKGKFLKSASYRQPEFYQVGAATAKPVTGLPSAFDPLPGL